MSRQHYFEMGEKAGKLLALQARSAAVSRLILRIKLPSGATVSNSKNSERCLFKIFTQTSTLQSTPPGSGVAITLLR